MSRDNNNNARLPHLRFYQGLVKSQWWPGNKLRSYQALHLKKILRHVVKTTDHYSQKFPDLEELFTPQTNMSLWQEIPLLTREQVQSSYNDLCSNQIPPSHLPIFKSSTSGSTGTPIQVQQTKLGNIIWQANTLRDHFWHERHLDGKLAIIRVFDENSGVTEMGKKAKGWGPATRFYSNGDSFLLPINTPIEKQADWLRDVDPDYVLTYPSNAFALADYFDANNLPLSNLKEIRTLGETLDMSTREHVKDVFGVKTTDVYSSQETGYIALQCPEHDHYHIQSESVFVEILDDDNRPCEAGEIGRVIVTVLHNYAMPLVRYEIGDYAEVGEPCPCGRSLPVIKRVLGRSRNLIRLPNGQKMWPLTGIQDYREIAPVIQAQLIQSEPLILDLNLKTERPLEKDELNALTGLLKSKTSNDFDINIVEMKEIPRSKNGKFEDVICKLS